VAPQAAFTEAIFMFDGHEFLGAAENLASSCGLRPAEFTVQDDSVNTAATPPFECQFKD
jgi:hypothetical protein